MACVLPSGNLIGFDLVGYVHTAMAFENDLR